MNAPASSANNTSFNRGTTVNVAVAAFGFLAILQGIIMLGSADGAIRWTGLAGAALTLALAFAPLGSRGKLSMIGVAALVLACNFVIFLILEPEPFYLRYLQVGVAAGYASMLVACLLALALPRFGLGILLSAMTLVLAFLLGEWSLSRTDVGALLSYNPDVMHWVGGTAPHPVLEEYYPPNTDATTFYDSDPNRYFTQGDVRSYQWQLNVADPATGAAMHFPDPAPSDRVRVTAGRPAQQIWQVQLAYSGLAVKSGEDLMIAFRVRAEQPRTIGVGVGQNHAPWGTLGLYKEVKVETAWQDVLIPFSTSGADTNGRLHFDLGTSGDAVDIEKVQVRRRISSVSIVRPIAPVYSVNYRFNDHGCRGVSIPSAPAPGRRRILVLGDSYGLGVGVHEKDSMPARLEHILNSGAGADKFDVVNCSVSGYSTLQERQMYEIQAPFYQPAVVIVPMVENDADSWRSDVRNGYFYQRTKFDRMFLAWGVFQAVRHAKPPADFSKNVQELRRLRDLCAKNGARLVVVSFRNGEISASNWGPLARTVQAGVAGTDIIWKDLGDVVKGQQSWQSLYVHPSGDYHPNAIAHARAATELAGLLKANGLAD